MTRHDRPFVKGLAILVLSLSLFFPISSAPKGYAEASTDSSQPTAGRDPSPETSDAPFVMTGIPTVDQATELEKTRRQMAQYGIEYLRQSQEFEGGWTSEKGIGPSLIVLIGLLRAGESPSSPPVAKGLDFILRSVQTDGGIYAPGGHISVYESCLALTCLKLAKDASGSDRYDEILRDGEKFIRGQQYSEENQTPQNSDYYGGLGYGKQTRPDLSNTQFFVETLRDLGADFDDVAIQRAVVFVSRCQNFDPGAIPTGDSPSPANAAISADSADSVDSTDTVDAGNPAKHENALTVKNGDGGFIYTCATDENPAGQETDGGLRSYGSITYAGLKSLIYAGLTQDDPRVAAASDWIRENYSMTQNPGLGPRGLYYYYHTMSKTLNVLGEDLFVDAAGTSHYWKGELIRVFAENQRMDGSWVNKNRMWFESDPNLVTGYALIVLSYCQP